MLKLARSRKDLSFPALMEVYLEENQRLGREAYPGEPEMRQLELAEGDFRQYLTESFFPTPGGLYAIWEEQGRYVSALRLEPFEDGLLLEALETGPGHRGRGYATRLVEAVQQLPQVGKLYSHVGKGNRPSQAVHQKCGFRQIADHAVYIDGSVDSRAVTLCWERK